MGSTDKRAIHRTDKQAYNIVKLYITSIDEIYICIVTKTL